MRRFSPYRRAMSRIVVMVITGALLAVALPAVGTVLPALRMPGADVAPAAAEARPSVPVQLYAGTWQQLGTTGNGGPALSAKINPDAIAVDGAGDLYIAEYASIRKVNRSTGVITRVAGTGAYGNNGSSGPATAFQLGGPSGLAVASSGDLYVSDSGNKRIVKISAGDATTIAGGGTDSVTDGAPATSVKLDTTKGVAVDQAGNVYFVDGISSIRRVAPDGKIYTFATAATFHVISNGIAVTPDGTAVYYGDLGASGSAIRAVNQSGVAIRSIPITMSATGTAANSIAISPTGDVIWPVQRNILDPQVLRYAPPGATTSLRLTKEVECNKPATPESCGVGAPLSETTFFSSGASNVGLAIDENSNLYMSDDLLGVVRGAPSAFLSPGEMEIAGGGANADVRYAACGCQNKTNYPVSLPTGNFWHTFTAFAIPGRINLGATHTYNSQNATVDAGLGYGWTLDGQVSLTIDGGTGNVAVNGETGTRTQFIRTGTGPDTYTAATRVTSTLARSGSDYVLTRWTGERLTFDSSGVLQARSDRNGNTLTYTHDTNGRLQTIADPAGRTLTFTWTGGHITRIADNAVPASRQVDFTYDPVTGDMLTWTDAAGNTTSFTYYAGHLLHTMLDPAQQSLAPSAQTPVTNTYDSTGRVISQSDFNGGLTTFTYTANGDGTTTITTTDPVGAVTEETYAGTQMTRQVLGKGTPDAQTWTFTYDLATNGLASKTNVTGGGALTSTTTYDAAGNVLTRTDELGHTTTFTYNAFNEPLTATDPAGTTTSYEYNTRGNLTGITQPLNSTETAVTTFTYDTTHPGDVTETKDPEGHITNYGYDAYGYRTSTTAVLSDGSDTTSAVFDNVGRPVSSTDGKGKTTHYSTDPLGRILTVTNPLGKVTATSFDANGRKTSETDANNHTTNYDYDKNGNQTAIHRADGTTLTSSYYADGATHTQTDGVTPTGNTTTFTYNALKQLTSQTDPGARTTTFTYNAMGRMATRTDALGRTTTYSYDDAGKLTTVTYGDGTTSNISAIGYDDNGRRTSMTDGTGTHGWTWDLAGRMTSSGSPVGTFGYEYYKTGTLKKLTYPGGKEVVYTDPDKAHVSTVKDWLGNTTTFTRNANGDMTSVAFPTSTPTSDTYTYNDARQLTQTQFTYRGVTTTLAYGRDNVGLLTSETATNMAGSIPSSTYSYDANNRLTGIGGTVPRTYGYDQGNDTLTTRADGTKQVFDPTSQLCYTAPGSAPSGACATPPTGATTYGHDANGNRVSTTPPATGTAQPTSYSYDSENRLIEATGSARPTSASDFSPVNQTKVFDTTDGTNTAVAQLAPLSKTTFKIWGKGGVPMWNQVNAVALTVTALNGGGSGGLAFYAGDTTWPLNYENLHYYTGRTVTGSVITRVDGDGNFIIHNGSNYAVDLQISVNGYFAPNEGGSFTVTDPTVIADTTASPGPIGTIPSLGSITVPVAGAGGIPASGAGSAALNLQVLNTSGGGGSLTVYAAGTTRPATNDLVFSAGQSASNLTFAPLGTTGTNFGKVTIYNNSPAPVDVRLGTYGWFAAADDPMSSSYVPLTRPIRLNGDSHAANTTVTYQVTGNAGVPASGVTAVMFAVETAANAGTGTVKIYASGAPTPTEAGLRFTNPYAAATTMPVALSSDGKIDVNYTTTTGSGYVYLTVVGYWQDALGQWTYTYDGDGNRATKVSPSGQTAQYGWSQNGGLPQLLMKKVSGVTNPTYYIYGPDGKPFEYIDPRYGPLFMHHDQLGSTRLVTDTAGYRAHSYNYDPYGNTISDPGTVADVDLQWAGQLRDAETGFYYMRARVYDPITGQFLTVDPLVSATRSPYGYVYGSPLNGTDPSGLRCKKNDDNIGCKVVNWLFGWGSSYGENGEATLDAAAAAGRAGTPGTITATGCWGLCLAGSLPLNTYAAPAQLEAGVGQPGWSIMVAPGAPSTISGSYALCAGVCAGASQSECGWSPTFGIGMGVGDFGKAFGSKLRPSLDVGASGRVGFPKRNGGSGAGSGPSAPSGVMVPSPRVIALG